MQGHEFNLWSGKIPGAAKPVPHSYRACAPLNPCSPTRGATTMRTPSTTTRESPLAAMETKLSQKKKMQSSFGMLQARSQSFMPLFLLCKASLVAQTVKHLPTMWQAQVRSLGWEYPLEKEMATHSSTLAWKMPWTEERGRLQSMGSQRVRRDFTFTFTLGRLLHPNVNSWQDRVT